MSRKKNNEEDVLLFYNINNKIIIKEINNYSFANTPNNFLLTKVKLIEYSFVVVISLINIKEMEYY